ncbi:cysteine-rich receptor-like protein kinase, partial [Trifolium pratense]
VEESPKLHFMSEQNYVGPQVSRFNKILWDTMNDIRNLTANVTNGSLKYAYKSVNITDTDNQTLYAMGNCIPYLSSDDCSRCLGDAMAEIQNSCCKGKTGGRIYFPSCAIRFELYSFYDPLASTTIQPPQLSTGTLASPGFA